MKKQHVITSLNVADDAIVREYEKLYERLMDIEAEPYRQTEREMLQGAIEALEEARGAINDQLELMGN